MMTTYIADTQSHPGLVPVYYPARLSDEGLSELKVWGKFCRTGDKPSHLLAAYVHALVSLETERRAVIEAGNEVLDVEMPPMPTPHWNNLELAAALGKLTSIAFSTEGEIRVLFQKLFNAALAETQFRLGMRD
jgi:hypothetical protein